MSESNHAPETPSACCRVLLLEDNVRLAQMLKRHFEIEGFHVTMVHLGQEALRLLGEQHFHLAMVDIDLPDTTGFEVMTKAAERGLLDNLKIIFCSGNPGAERGRWRRGSKAVFSWENHFRWPVCPRWRNQ